MAVAWGWQRRGEDGEVSIARARSGSSRRGGGGDMEACGGGGMKACSSDGGNCGWTPSLAFLEQRLERKSTVFFLQMIARVCGGVPSPLIGPIMGREGKGPT